MTDNKYIKIMSEIKLSDEKKREIKLNLKRELGYIKDNEDVPAVSENRKSVAGRLMKIFVPLALVAAIVAICVYATLPRNFSEVTHPLSAEDSAYIAEVTENAQYLPNEKILASASGSMALSSSNNISDITDSRYDKAYKISDGELDLDIDDYREFNDSLAVISDTSASSNISTIYELKAEMEFAASILPGRDQWFKLSSDLPHLTNEDEDNYGYQSYKVSFDKKSGKINMQRLSWYTVGAAYDPDTGTFYADSVQNQFISVDFYVNDEGKEVVDCTVIDYLHVTDDIYYPVSSQRIINVKDTSMTKYAAVYMREYELTGKVQSYYNTAYDLSERYNSGITAIALQLDYTSADDVSLLKTQYVEGDGHCKMRTLSAIDYYRKQNGTSTYFVSNWSDVTLYIDIPYRISLNGYVNIDRQPDGTYKVSEESFKNAFTNILYLRRNFLCDRCLADKTSKDGIFIDCDHGGNFDGSVKYSKTQILSNDLAALADIDSVRGDISECFGRLSQSLSLDTRLTTQTETVCVFENAVNDFIKALGSNYYDVYVKNIDLKTIDGYTYKNSVKLFDDTLFDVISEKFSFPYSIRQYNSFENDTLKINVQAKINLEKDLPKDSVYYFAILIHDAEDLSEHAILNKTQVNPSEKDAVYGIKTDITASDILGYTLSFNPIFKKGDSFVIRLAVVAENGGKTTVLSASKLFKLNLDSVYSGIFRNDGVPYNFNIKEYFQESIIFTMLENHVEYIYPHE